MDSETANIKESLRSADLRRQAYATVVCIATNHVLAWNHHQHSQAFAFHLLIVATTTTVLQILYRTICVSRYPPLKTGEFCFQQTFTVHMPLLTATSALGLGRRC